MGNFRSTILLAAVFAVLGLPAMSFGDTTVDKTIQDTDSDNLLEEAPGEDYTVLGGPPGFRPPEQGSLLNYLQMSDFQAIDEESPGRVEFLDTTQRGSVFSPFASAYRPHESLSTQIIEAMVRQVRGLGSPLSGRKLDHTILTGDNADSQQYNEVRWFIDILDGERKIDPNSGVPIPGCEATPGSIYDGVRGGGKFGYYEPDASANQEDGDGYSPDRAENQTETGRDVTVRDFPRLLEAANAPFSAQGLRMPWYTAFGNHDALVQGNSPDAYLGPFGTSPEASNPAFQALATGCLKPSSLPDDLRALLEQGDLTPEQVAQFYEDFFANPDGQILSSTAPVNVPPDARRCYLAKDENPPLGGGAPAPCNRGGFVQQHFITRGAPVGHGFAPTSTANCVAYPAERACRNALTPEQRAAGYGRPAAAVATHDGYYSYSPRRGMRHVVLDTITDECGSEVCAEGSIDDSQFRWLESQILKAEAMGQYVTVFSHHTLRTTRFPSTDGTEEPIHFGQRVDRKGAQPQNLGGGQTLEELYCQHPNVIAHIAGHEHENYVLHYRCSDDEPPTAGAGEFWHVSTAAHLDWPQQSRMVELFDNCDGTMSMALTMIDQAGPADPGEGAARAVVPRLASIARELSYNDYQANRGARGAPEDRNVIIVMDKSPPPGSHCDADGDGDDDHDHDDDDDSDDGDDD